MTLVAMQDHLGPIDFVAVTFPDGRVGGDGFGLLLDLVDKGDVFVIDLEFLVKQSDTLQTTDAESLHVPELAVFQGADSHLLDGDDLTLLGADLPEGAVVAVLIYEIRTVLPVLAAWEGAGGQVLAQGAISIDDLELALDQDEDDD